MAYKLTNAILGPEFSHKYELLMLWYSILYAYHPDGIENTGYYVFRMGVAKGPYKIGIHQKKKIQPKNPTIFIN